MINVSAEKLERRQPIFKNILCKKSLDCSEKTEFSLKIIKRGTNAKVFTLHVTDGTATAPSGSRDPIL